MSKEEKTNLYEGMYLLSAGISEDQQQQSLKAIEDEIVSRGGVVHKKHELGRRRLAYEINGVREGQYHLWYFDAKPSAITEMWKEYRLSRENLHLLRFVTLRAKSVMEEVTFKPVKER